MVTIPEGTTLTIWAAHGDTIPDRMGRLIEAGDYAAVLANYPAQAGARVVYLAGAEVHNYTLMAPTRLTVMRNSITVEDATPLSSLLRPGMGPLDWAACCKVRY